METIGFIGLGNMGGNMAARYLAAGYPVYGEAQDRAAAQWLIDQGLRWADIPREECWADIPREVAEAVDVVLTSLPDEDIVDEVLERSAGLDLPVSPGFKSLQRSHQNR